MILGGYTQIKKNNCHKSVFFFFCLFYGLNLQPKENEAFPLKKPCPNYRKINL